MSMMNEKELVEEVESFFNEEDREVGLYATGVIDKMVIDEFKEAFSGIEIISYTNSELEFGVGEDNYKVVSSTAYDQWKVYKLIKLC
jgi:mRNA-degrading endonuclease HigB of HigAB toxin-antitoxin module